jgi:hypothetical protein
MLKLAIDLLAEGVIESLIIWAVWNQVAAIFDFQPVLFLPCCAGVLLYLIVKRLVE